MEPEVDLHAWRAAAAGLKWVRAAVLAHIALNVLTSVATARGPLDRATLVAIGGGALVIDLVACAAAASIAWRGPIARPYAVVSALGCFASLAGEVLPAVIAGTNVGIVLVIVGWFAQVAGMLTVLGAALRAMGCDAHLKLVRRAQGKVIVGLPLLALGVALQLEVLVVIGAVAMIFFLIGFIQYVVALGRVRAEMLAYAPEPPRATAIS